MEEAKVTREESGLPVVSSLPNIFLTDNAKVVNYFSAKGRKQWCQTSLTLLLKTPADWNKAYSTSHTDAMQCKKDKHTIVQPRLPQLVRQCNAQRARGLDDARCRKEAEDKPKCVESSFVENYFTERLFPDGTDEIPKQVSVASLMPQPNTPPMTAHLDTTLEAYLRRCAGFYAAASQFLMTNSTIYLHRSTFCRFILDCQLAHVHRMPYVTAIELGFEKWKRVASGGESGKTGLEILELPNFSQSVVNLVRMHYPDDQAEYFYHQNGNVKTPHVIGPLLRYAEERIPYCEWIDERYGKRCNQIPAKEDKVSMTWQRRMVRNMLIEPGVIHLITAYRWVFTALFEAYAINAHVTLNHFLRFCRDFNLVPTMGAHQLFVSAYNNAECVGTPVVPPDHTVIQKLALRPMRERLPVGTTWEKAWQKLFGKEVASATYDMWDQALMREKPEWGITTRHLMWDALMLQPNVEDYIAPWLRPSCSRASTPSSTFSELDTPELLSTTFVKTLSSLWPVTSQPRKQATERDVDRQPTDRTRRKSMPDLWSSAISKVTSVTRLASPVRNSSPDNNKSEPPDIVDFILYLTAEHHNIHEAWNALLTEAEETEFEDDRASRWSISPLSSNRRRSISPKRGSQPHVSSPTAGASSSSLRAVPPARKPKSDTITEAAFVRLVVPKYTHSHDYAAALFHRLCKCSDAEVADADTGEEKKKSSRMLNRRHTSVGLGLPMRSNPKANKPLVRAISCLASPTHEVSPPNGRGLTIKHLQLAARECTNRSKYSSASAEPTSQSALANAAKLQVKKKEVIPPEKVFGLASFIEAVCTAVFTHLSFYGSEVHQNTSSVNKLCVFLSHVTRCVKEHPPWNHWTPSASPSHRSSSWLTTRPTVFPDDSEAVPDSRKTQQRQSTNKWSDEFFPEDEETCKRRTIRNDERTWATYKRLLWALQRLDSMDLRDPPMFTPLLNTRPPATPEHDDMSSNPSPSPRPTVVHCTCPRTSAGWGTPTCTQCSCVSRALLLQVYPLRALMGTPNVASIVSPNTESGPSVAEPVPSPFTTLTAFRPKTMNEDKECESPESRASPNMNARTIKTSIYI